MERPKVQHNSAPEGGGVPAVGQRHASVSTPPRSPSANPSLSSAPGSRKGSHGGTTTSRTTRGPVIGGAIVDVRVKAAPVARKRGCMAVHPEELVTLLACDQPERNRVYVQNALGEVGCIPPSWLHLDLHTSNVYLRAVARLAREAPSVLETLCAAEPLPDDLVALLLTADVLPVAITALVRAEVDDKAKRGLASETLRAESPAVLLVGAVLRAAGPSVRVLQQDVVRVAVKATQEQLNGRVAESDALAAVLYTVTEHLRSVAVPPLLALVLQSVRDACADDAVRNVLPASLFCLRVVCPALVQVQSGGDGSVSDSVSNALRTIAKALQLAANGVEPGADTPLYALRMRLPPLRAALQHCCSESASRAVMALSVRVARSLVWSAVELYRRALAVGGTAAETALAPLGLGAPPSREQCDMPPLVLELEAQLAATVPRQVEDVVKENPVLAWSVQDVSDWLRASGCSDYAAKFAKEQIGGPELLSLTEEDLLALGVFETAHQDMIQACMAAMASGSNTVAPLQRKLQRSASAPGVSRSASVTLSDTASSASSSSPVSERSPHVRIRGAPLDLRCVLGDERRTVTVKRTHTLERVLQKLEETFGTRVQLSVRNRRVTEQLEWSDVVARHGVGDALEVALVRESVNAISAQERALLHGLSDACIVCDKSGIVLFCNLAAEELFGYALDAMTGRNVNILIEPESRERHDGYLRRYLHSGVARVMNTSRTVTALTSTGQQLCCRLALTEQRTLNGRHTFMATMRVDHSSHSAQFAVLDAVQEPVLVVDAQGLIEFQNAHMAKLLGYERGAIVGVAIMRVVPDFYACELEPCVVAAVRHNGSSVSVHLEVNECTLEGARYRVGLFRARDSARSMSLLERTRVVVNQLVVPSLVINALGVVQVCNSAVCTLLGYSAAEMRNRNVRMFMLDSDDAWQQRDVQLPHSRPSAVVAAAHVGSTSRVVSVKRRDGRVLRTALSVSKAVDPDDADNVLFTGIFTGAVEN